MAALCKKSIVAIQLLLISAINTQAAPTPAVVISDQIIGTTPASFFVIRTFTLNMPTYNQYQERIEFVELSTKDGSILQKCALRETQYNHDPGADQVIWTKTEVQKPSCQVFELLSKRGAGYMKPQSTETHRVSYRLVADGLEARDETSDGSAKWTNVMSAETIQARAAKTTSVTAYDIPWRIGEDMSAVLSLIGGAIRPEPVHKQCELDPVPVTSRFHDHVFFRFLCWGGSDDEDGANFYMAAG